MEIISPESQNNTLMPGADQRDFFSSIKLARFLYRYRFQLAGKSATTVTGSCFVGCSNTIRRA